MMSTTAVVGRLTPVSTHIKYNTLAAVVEAGDPSASLVTMLPVGGPAVAASALPGGKVARPVGCVVAPVSSLTTPSTAAIACIITKNGVEVSTRLCLADMSAWQLGKASP